MVDRIRVRDTILAATVLALGAFIGVETWMAPAIQARAVVSPGFFPGLVAIALLLVGARLLYEVITARIEAPEFPEVDWRAVGILAGAFLLMIFMLEPVGWILSGTFMFCAGAYAFGRSKWTNVLYGLALTTVTYFVFDYGLDLALPMGTLIEDAIILLGGQV